MAKIKHTPHWNGMFYRARVGPVKRNWVRTFILRIPRLDGKHKVRRQNSTDDMGRDFVREMSFADAMTDATFLLDTRMQQHRGTGTLQALNKTDKKIARCYLKSGYAEDPAFQKLSDKWDKYNVATRLHKMRRLAVYDSLFKCCALHATKCECGQRCAQYLHDKVASRKSLVSALIYVFKKRT